MWKLFFLPSAQCGAWCCPKACQDAELMSTLDPGLGPIWWKGVLVRWVGSQVPRCPEMMVRGSCWLWLGFPSFGHAGFHRWLSWQQGALSFLTS